MDELSGRLATALRDMIDRDPDFGARDADEAISAVLDEWDRVSARRHFVVTYVEPPNAGAAHMDHVADNLHRTLGVCGALPEYITWVRT